MDEKEEDKDVVFCKECENEVSLIIQTFNISLHSRMTMIQVEATDICLGCFSDLLARSILNCGDC